MHLFVTGSQSSPISSRGYDYVFSDSGAERTLQ